MRILRGSQHGAYRYHAQDNSIGIHGGIWPHSRTLASVIGDKGGRWQLATVHIHNTYFSVGEPSYSSVHPDTFPVSARARPHKVIRRSQNDPARPPAGKLTLQVQVPRFLDEPQTNDQMPGARRADAPVSVFAEELRGGSDEGALRIAPTAGIHRDHVKITAKFVVAYSGVGEIRDATLNISPPPGILAEPSSALLPPFHGSGSGREGGQGGNGEPIVVAVVLQAERGTGILPSTLLGEASVVYTRQVGKDGAHEPMSARCDLQLPLAMCARVVETTKNGSHKFTFDTNQLPLPLHTLFEDMVVPQENPFMEDSKSNAPAGGPAAPRIGGGGAIKGRDGGEVVIGGGTTLSFRYWAADDDGVSRDVTVAVSKNSGRYRVQSESLPALSVISTETVRRLKDHFGERDRSGGSFAGEEKARRAEGEPMFPCFLPMFCQSLTCSQG